MGKKRTRKEIIEGIKGFRKKSLLDLISLKMELEERLKREVDIAEYVSIHPLLKERILNEEVRIL